MRGFILTLFCFFNFLSFSQEKDSLVLLLTNPKIQFECLEAVDSMYNFNFEVAEQQYNWLKQSYPEHPLPYFLLALNEWWKILPNEYVKDYDESFMAYIDLAIEKAKVLYKDNKTNPEATFFLSASYGFKARLNAERGNYTGATFNSKKALNYLMENKEANPELVPEFMFGVALYDYYRAWIPENKKFMKPVIMFFPKGDKKSGIEQLQKVATESFYTRVEAMRYLVKIYSGYEGKHKKAWEHISYLHNLYPRNPYFTRTYAKVAFKSYHQDECIEACLHALNLIDQGAFGYESETGRVCSYMLGHIYDIKKDYDKAAIYFKKCVEFTEMPNNYSTGYTVMGINKLAQYALDNNNEEEAFIWYSKLLELSEDKKSEMYKKAKKFVKKNKIRYQSA